MGSGNGQHPYQACRDPECERYACRIYREGFDDGHAAGFAAGYDAGFVDGIASCPRSHSG